MISTPLDRYSFEDIDRQVAPFLQENSLRKPPVQQQELIDWIRKPSPGRLLSFIEVISLAGKYQDLPTEKKHIVPWAETALSMTRNDDNVFRLEGRCHIAELNMLWSGSTSMLRNVRACMMTGATCISAIIARSNSI